MADNKDKESTVIAGFVLYKDANMDWPRFRRSLKEDWGIKVQDEVKDGAVVFRVDGMTVACSLMPMPVPENEAEENAKNNVFWKDAAAEVAKHKAHVMVAVMDRTDPLSQALLLAKVSYSLLSLKNAIGIYRHPTVYQKEFYMDFARTIKDGELPMPILIYTGMYLAKTGICAYTAGLRSFGKMEIEIVDSQKQHQDVMSFLLSIAEYVVSGDVELKDGETIGFTEEMKLPITVSDGVSVPGTTVKIGF